MNKLIFASLAAVAVSLVGTPKPAEARDGDKAVAAMGGFIGGLIVGSAINDSPSVVVAHRPSPQVRVVVSHGHRHDRRHGHWEWVTVREWVPGHWAYVDRGRGRDRGHRVWVAGHYDYRRDRVWVAHRGFRHQDRR